MLTLIQQIVLLFLFPIAYWNVVRTPSHLGHTIYLSISFFIIDDGLIATSKGRVEVFAKSFPTNSTMNLPTCEVTFKIQSQVNPKN